MVYQEGGRNWLLIFFVLILLAVFAFWLIGGSFENTAPLHKKIFGESDTLKSAVGQPANLKSISLYI